LINKTLLQEKALNIWKSNKGIGTLEIATGVGKTKIALDAIKAVYNRLLKEDENHVFKCLIIVPTEVIRDQVFPSEFEKWNMLDIMSKFCQIECIQTVYKYIDRTYDLVIVDEIHRILPIEDQYEYYKFFNNNTYKYILGLSATIDKQQLFRLNRIAPVCFKYTLDNALEDGIISAFKIYNVAVSLTEEEKVNLGKIQRNYNYYEGLLGGKFEAFDEATKYLGGNYLSEQISVEELKVKKMLANNFFRAIKARKKLLEEAAEKQIVLKELLDIKPFKESQGIIFSGSTKVASKLIEINNKVGVYHSLKPQKSRAETLNLFNEGTLRYLSTVNALNEGLSINSIEFAITLASSSKARILIQRCGRICRYVKNKQAILINLYIEDSQEVKYLRSSQLNLTNHVIWCKSIDDFKDKINE